MLIRLNLEEPSEQESVLEQFLVFCCSKSCFKSPQEKDILARFLVLLLDSLTPESILCKYKSSFEYIYSKMPNLMTENFVMNTLSFIGDHFLQGDIRIRDCEYLIGPISFALIYPSTYNTANRYLNNIHQGRRFSRGKVEQLLKLKIKDETLRAAYEEWLGRYTIE